MNESEMIWSEIETAPGVSALACHLCGCLVARDLKEVHELHHASHADPTQLPDSYEAWRASFDTKEGGE